MKRNTTFSAKEEKVTKNWYLADAEGKVLGRLAARVADVLRGKDEEIFTPNCDTGDFVVVINASKIRVTGKKQKEKIYFSHSGYPHGAKSINLEEKMKRSPEDVIRHAVRGMLPRGRLGDRIINKLKIYKESKFEQTAQKPQKLEI